MKTFWMVHVKGGCNPAHEHATRVLAREEAARLCRKEGRPAYVLEATEMCTPANVTWSILEELDENDPGAGWIASNPLQASQRTTVTRIWPWG